MCRQPQMFSDLVKQTHNSSLGLKRCTDTLWMFCSEDPRGQHRAAQHTLHKMTRYSIVTAWCKEMRNKLYTDDGCQKHRQVCERTCAEIYADIFFVSTIAKSDLHIGTAIAFFVPVPNRNCYWNCTFQDVPETYHSPVSKIIQRNKVSGISAGQIVVKQLHVCVSQPVSVVNQLNGPSHGNCYFQGLKGPWAETKAPIDDLTCLLTGHLTPTTADLQAFHWPDKHRLCIILMQLWTFWL